MNGELSSETPGFSKIVIHLKEDQHVEVDSSKIVVRDKQSVSHYSGDEPHTVGRCCILIFPWWTRFKHTVILFELSLTLTSHGAVYVQHHGD